MNEIMEGQHSLFGPDTASGKTCQERCPQAEAKTSKRSSRSSSGSATRKLPMCLCLTRANGPIPGGSTTRWEDGAWPGASMTLSTWACRSGADGSVSFAISTGSQHPRFCLTLNCGEKPRTPIPTKLSEILEEDPDPTYRLSPRACQGILNRAARRGKELPPELKAALEEQSASRSEPESPEEEKGSSCRENMSEHCPQSTTSPSATPSPQALTNRGYESGQITETVRGGCHGALPMVTEVAVDVYNQTVEGQTAPSLTAASGGRTPAGRK